MDDEVLIQYITSNLIYIEAVLFGIFFGFLFVFIHHLFESTALRKLSYGINIILKSIFYLIGLVIVGGIIFIIYTLMDVVPQFLTEKRFFSPDFVKLYTISILMLIFSLFLCNMFIVINKKFGTGVFWDMILGKYYKPRIEERIFMFLDLKDSTIIAEKIGHSNYSKVIKSCFHDITELVLKYNAEIYPEA